MLATPFLAFKTPKEQNTVPIYHSIFNANRFGKFFKPTNFQHIQIHILIYFQKQLDRASHYQLMSWQSDWAETAFHPDSKELVLGKDP